MPRTTIALDATTRDALTRVSTELASATADETVRRLIWEHDCAAALQRLDGDPQLLAGYQEESQLLAESDVSVSEP